MNLHTNGFARWAPSPCRPAMTLPEFLLALGLIGVALLLVAGAIRHVRDQGKVEQTRAFLARIDRALAIYHRAHGAYPPGDRRAGSADCLAALRSHPPAWSALASSSPLLIARPPDARPYFQDGWATPIRYLTAAGTGSMQSRVAVNAGRPILESAGPDRDFGDLDHAGLTDNIATDHLTPE